MNGPQYREGSSFTRNTVSQKNENRIPQGWMMSQYRTKSLKSKLPKLNHLKKSSKPQYRKPPCPPS